MQNAISPIKVYNRLVDSKSSIVVEVVAPRSLGKHEMEILMAQALEKLKVEEWPKAGEVLTVMAMDEDDTENEWMEYVSRWMRSQAQGNAEWVRVKGE